MSRDRCIFAIAVVILYVMACVAWAAGWEATARIWFAAIIWAGVVYAISSTGKCR